MLPLIALLFSGCATNTVRNEPVPDSFCLNYHPIRYSRSRTPQDVQDQIDQQNAKYDAVCKKG